MQKISVQGSLGVYAKNSYPLVFCPTPGNLPSLPLNIRGSEYFAFARPRRKPLTVFRVSASIGRAVYATSIALLCDGPPSTDGTSSPSLATLAGSLTPAPPELGDSKLLLSFESFSGASSSKMTLSRKTSSDLAIYHAVPARNMASVSGLNLDLPQTTPNRGPLVVFRCTLESFRQEIDAWFSSVTGICVFLDYDFSPTTAYGTLQGLRYAFNTIHGFVLHLVDTFATLKSHCKLVFCKIRTGLIADAKLKPSSLSTPFPSFP